MSSYKDYRLSSDTTPEAEALIFKLLAKKTAAEKLQMMSRMSVAVRGLAMSGLRERHPGATDLELKVRLVELLYGADLARDIAGKLKECQRGE